MNTVHLLIVEDEPMLASTLASGLRGDAFTVDVAHDGASALQWLEDNDADVVILDRDLPLIHGDTVCRTLIANNHSARILMLTAASALEDIIAGFGLGADDYLAKPFSYLELVARVTALGRRGAERSGRVSGILEYGAIRIDQARQRAEVHGLPTNLTPKEFGILRELAMAGGGFRTSLQLLDAVWEDPWDRTTDVVKVTIHSLRTKLPSRALIENVSGFGYRLASP